MVATLTTIVINIAWAFVYWIEHPWINQYKALKYDPWPWHEDPNFKSLLWKAIKVFCFNIGVMNNLCQLFVIFIVCGGKNYVNFDKNQMPGPLTIAKQQLIFAIMDDFCFYFFHRLFHSKSPYLPLYQWFHKMHHEFKHTITIAFVYAHPFEYIFCNWFVPHSGIFLLSALYGAKQVHIISFMMFLNLRVAESMEGHSGYIFPKPVSVLLGNLMALNPFMATEPAYHEFHHSRNVGNYSTFFTIWDTVFASNADYYQYLQETEEKGNEGQ